MRKLSILLMVSAIFVIFLAVAFLVFRPKQTSQIHSLLAVNTDKSVYFPGENVKFQIASSCDCNLRLEVNGLEQKITKTGSEYVANLLVQKEGMYNITLTNLDNKEKTSSSFVVQKTRDFEIVRSGATQIDSLKVDRYPMVITVKASKDYQGQIKEQFPADFKIMWQGFAKIEGTNLVWDVNLKAGETKTLSYEYQAPKISPAVYDLKLSINGQFLSNWQLVAINL